MTVLERDAFLASLVEYAGEAESGSSRLVFLAGEAGVGKTTLLELLRDRLPQARWVAGACDGSFTPQPLGPLYDAAPQLGGAIAAACAEDAPRDRLFRTLLEQLSLPSSLFTVLVIEDAHWADEATMDLVRFLGRRLRDSSTLLIVSYRDDGMPANHPLRLTLGDLTPERSLRRMTLSPLSPAAVSALAADTGVSGDELYALTGGNPFFVNEVLGINSPALPISARDAVLARVARLSADARAVLNAAAVLGDADPALVLHVAERSDGVDECLSNGALVSEPATLRFRHELARLAVVDGIASHHRRELHARALAALRVRPDAALARLAHHAEGALDAEAVLDYAVRAGQRAADMSAHREATVQFSRALRFAADRPIAERADLHDRLATEQLLIEDWRQADEERVRAVALWRQTDDRLRLGNSLRLLSRIRLRMYDKSGLDFMDDSIVILEELPPSRELAWAYSNKAGALMYSDPPRAVECAQFARKVLESSGVDDPGLVSDSLNSEACALSAMNEGATVMLEDALRVALDGNAFEPASRAYTNLVCTLVNLNQFKPALTVAEEGIPFSEDHELDMYMHCLIGAHLGVLDKLGRWDEALETASHELAKPTLSPFNRAGPLLTSAVIHARRGNRKVAEPMVAEAVVVMNDMGCYEEDLRHIELAWLDGDLDDARTRAVALAKTPGVAAELTTELAVWLKRLGENVDDYDLMIDPVRARQLGEPWPDVAAMWAELGSPYEQALALYDSGDEDAMREAITILGRLGAMATINVVRGEMRRLGYTSIPRGVRSATREDGLGLTKRQREVLELLAEGLTNADIGRRLFLSERTVDNHVTAVLAKLGAESRREAVRLAAASGALEASTK